VVCAGAKSILDLPATLEVLETHGVPIVGFGTDTFPGFYSRSTGLPIDVRVDTPRDAAEIIAATRRLRAQHAVLVAVPVPEKDEFPSALAEAAIQQATTEADTNGIRGNRLTPFLLKRVSELTDAAARSANMSLLVNSARVGGLIARELSAIE
jgi:pseudouridine-5'-phosphate glycosidase